MKRLQRKKTMGKVLSGKQRETETVGVSVILVTVMLEMSQPRTSCPSVASS